MLFRVLKQFQSGDRQLQKGDEIDLPLNSKIQTLIATRHIIQVEAVDNPAPEPATRQKPKRMSE